MKTSIVGVFGGVLVAGALVLVGVYSSPAAYESEQVSCGVAATALLAADAGYRGWVVKNDAGNSVDVYLGGSDVTTSNGFILKPGDQLADGGSTRPGTDFALGDPLWCRVATVSTTLHVLWNK